MMWVDREKIAGNPLEKPLSYRGTSFIVLVETAGEQIANQLRDAIINAELLSGQRLKQDWKARLTHQAVRNY